jgi:membrane fusion protein (multidrug efflux system)
LAFNISGLVQEVYIGIGDVVQVGDALVQLETVVLEANVARAESALQIAQAEFENSKKQLEPLELQTVADARINIAEADLIIARYALKQATLTAPFDGSIVDVQVVPGETVNSGRVIITLANLQIFQVETLDLEEMDVPRIYEGQPVVVYIEALDIKVDGSVEKIAPQATVLGENGVYKVTVKLNFQPQGLYWGMSAEVKFIVNK